MSHKYIPNQKSDHEKMLQTIGLDNIDDLFSSIPEDVKLNRRFRS